MLSIRDLTIVLGVALLLLASGAQVVAQAGGGSDLSAGSFDPGIDRFDLGVGAGVFIDYPAPFSDSYCEEGAVGVTGTGAWRALRFLSIEGSLSVTTGAGGQVCAIPLEAPLPADTPYTNVSYAEEIEGSGFFATHLSLVVEPFPTAPVSPRARVGVGRLWDKSLNNWLWGLGVRYRFGRHSLVMDVEGWNMDIDAEVQTLIYRSATSTTEVLGTETVPETVRPYQVRVGWEVVIG